MDASQSVRPIDKDDEHLSWSLGRGHVVRLALTESGSRRQRREIALRDLIRPHIGVVVPVSVAAGEWADGLAFTIDTRPAGTSSELRRVSLSGEKGLARMLNGLMSLPLADVTTRGLPTRAPRSVAELRAPAEEAAARLTADGEFDGAPLRGPANLPALNVVVHHGLKGAHVLVGSGGRVGGVLNWADAVIGDPAEDIAGLAIAVGAAAAARVAAGAGYGPMMWAKGIALARHDTLIRLANRLYGTDDSPLPLLRAQRDRAWERSCLDRTWDSALDEEERWPWPTTRSWGRVDQPVARIAPMRHH